MGSLTARGSDTFTYDDRQRLSSYGAGTNYRYNGRGERVRKVDGVGGTTYFHYDEAGHLIAESQPSMLGPVPRYSYVWLDDHPVAVYAHPDALSTPPYASQWLHIHTDHLGTPRAITRPAGHNAVVWRWDFTGSAFGDHAPQPDPDGDGTHFTFNLRFPGQYYDQESGLHYNYFRDYEATAGRYSASDPVGLWGGASSYSYAYNSPLNWFDSRGLTASRAGAPPPPPPPSRNFSPGSGGNAGDRRRATRNFLLNPEDPSTPNLAPGRPRPDDPLNRIRVSH